MSDLINLHAKLEPSNRFVLTPLSAPFDQIENFEYYIYEIQPFSIFTKVGKSKKLEFSFFSTKDNHAMLDLIEEHAAAEKTFDVAIKLVEMTADGGDVIVCREFSLDKYQIDEIQYGPLSYSAPNKQSDGGKMMILITIKASKISSLISR